VAEPSDSRIRSAQHWSLIESLGQRLLQFAFGIVLARLLLPEHFGLLAMVLALLAVCGSLIEGGFTQALIQQADRSDHRLQTSVFWLNVAMALGLAVILASAAAPLSRAFDDARLRDLFVVLSVVLLTRPFIAAQYAHFAVALDFRAVARAGVYSVVGGGLAGVAGAWLGMEVWALALQQLVTAVLQPVLLWTRSCWRPALVLDLPSLRRLVPFALPMMGAGALNALFGNLYQVAIGRGFGAGELGYYSRALQLQQIPSQALTDPLRRTAFASLSHHSTEPERIKSEVRQTLALLLLLVTPLMLGLASISEPLIRVLFTDKWLPAADYLPLLIVLGLFYPLHSLNLVVLQSIRRADLFWRLDVVKQGLTLFNIVVTLPLGPKAMVIGQAILSAVAYLLNAGIAGPRIGYPIREQLADALPYFAGAGLMVLAIMAVRDPSAGAWQTLLLTLPVAAGSYGLFCLVVRPRGVRELQQRLYLWRGADA